MIEYLKLRFIGVQGKAYQEMILRWNENFELINQVYFMAYNLKAIIAIDWSVTEPSHS